MSPVDDPRFSGAHRTERIQKEREESERQTRLEYIKPLLMLALGAVGVMAISALQPSDGPDDLSGPGLAALYPIILAFKLAFGVAGLYVASILWLGGAGPLGLGILRLAGIYALTDLLAIIVEPLMVVGWLLRLAVYVGLLAWLFDLAWGESVLLAMITWALKFVAGMIIFALLINAF